MQITLNVPDNLPATMVQYYLKTLEEQMQLVSELIKPKQKNSTETLHALFKKTQNLPSVQALTDEDIENEITNYRNGL